MKKQFTLATMLVFVVMSSVSAQGNIDTKAYKFSMVIPENFGFKQTNKDGFTKIEGYNAETETKINAYAYIGAIDKQKVYDFGAKESGITKSSWEAVDSGTDENGFAWWEIYEAEVGDKMMYAVVAKNKYSDVFYMFYALATPESYEVNQDQYLEWAMSCQGIE